MSFEDAEMRTSQRLAFTIIELLVVIAIIAILVSILMPSLSKSRDLAIAVSCQQNQRSIYTLIRWYANDYNDALPYATRSTDRHWSAWNEMQLPVRMTSYMNQHAPGWLCPGWPIDKPYVDYPVMGTPTKPSGTPMPATPQNFGIGYYYVPYMWVDFWGPALVPENLKKVNFVRLNNPAKAKIMSCLMEQQGYDTPQNLWRGWIGPHHKGTRWIMLMADGAMYQTSGRWLPPDYSLDIYTNSAGDWSPKGGYMHQ